MKKAVGLMKMSDASLAGASGASFGGLTTAETMEGFEVLESGHLHGQPCTIAVPKDDMPQLMPLPKSNYYER